MKKLGLCLGACLLSSATITAYADLYRVDVATVLTVRAEPNANATAVGTLARNTQVDVQQFIGASTTIGDKQGRWAKIHYTDQPAYVFGGFLKLEIMLPNPSPSLHLVRANMLLS